MGRGLVGLALVLCACEARLGAPAGIDATGGATDAADPTDAAIDAFVLGAWGPPAKIPGASGTASEDDGTLSTTTLELVFAIQNVNDANRKDLWVTSRASLADAWATPTQLALSVTGATDETPRFSADDLTLFFASDRAGGAGGLDIWKVTRAAIGGPWGTPTRVAGVNTAANEKWFVPCGTQGRYLVIVGGDIAEGTLGMGLPAISADLSAPAANETGTFLTGDCTTTYFASVRSGDNRIYTSARTAPTMPWSVPTEVVAFSVLGGNQEDPWVSADGRTFLFVSDISGTKDLYLSTR